MICVRCVQNVPRSVEMRAYQEKRCVERGIYVLVYTLCTHIYVRFNEPATVVFFGGNR